MKKIYLEEKRVREKRFAALTSFIIAISMFLALVQLLLSNHLASFGREVAALEREQKELVYENELLEMQIAKETSIAALSEKASQLSFAAPVDFLVVGQQEYMAHKFPNDL